MTGERPAVFLLGDSLDLGGTEGQFVAVACGLDRTRWDVEVSCVRAEGPLDRKLEAAGVEVWSSGPPSLKSPRALGAVWRMARHLRRGRIALVHSFGFYSNMLAIPAARLAGVSAVAASQRDLGDLRPATERRVELALLRWADRIIVNSEAVARALATARPHLSRRIELVRNGVDVSRFSPARAGRNGSTDQVTIGTLANLRREKGLEYFVRAAALVRGQHPASRFVIWGEGPLREELTKLTAALGLDGAVELPGRAEDPAAVLRDLDVFVLPSLSEASSNALIEAMATGLPVVATRVGGTSLIVADGECGLLVPPRDPAALAAAVLRLVDDPSLANSLGSRARARVCDEFAAERMLARLEELYQRMLGGGRS